MRRHELAIEQDKAGKAHPPDKMGKRHLGCIADAAEHAFAKKGTAQGNAIEPAHQLLMAIGINLPAFDTVRMAQPGKRGITLLDHPVDPGGGAIIHGGGAFADHACKILVQRDTESLLPQRLRQRAGQAKAIKRQDGAAFRLDPVNLPRIAAVCHGKHADGIGMQQQIKIERHGHQALASRAEKCQPSRRRRVRNGWPEAGRAKGGWRPGYGNGVRP